LLPAWLDLTARTEVTLGLDPQVALNHAERLLAELRTGKPFRPDWTTDQERVEVLHALVAMVCIGWGANEPKTDLANIELVFTYISSLPWPTAAFGGSGQLLSDCALGGWRIARLFAPWSEVEKWRDRIDSTSDTRARAEKVLLTPPIEVARRATELGLEDLSILLYVCRALRSFAEQAPAHCKELAEFVYGFISDPTRSIGIRDEREYLLGDFALMTGAASRFLFQRDESTTWFSRAATHIESLKRPELERLRLTYQELAFRGEDRRYSDVLHAVDSLAESFRRLELPEEALKCRFLEGAVRFELGDVREVARINEEICAEAQSLGSSRLLGQATSNLLLCYGSLGEIDRALVSAKRAQATLRQSGDRVHLVRLWIGIGGLLRRQGDTTAALDASRQALEAALDLGMRGDVAALRLMIADLLLGLGQEAQAEAEIRAALPIIDEEKMVPEGIAALSLLRESLRRRQIDKQALRDLHGYFQEK
jgi:tetratricopeptide (TPR) repeat protein